MRQSLQPAERKKERSFGRLLWISSLALLVLSSFVNILLAAKTRQLRGVITALKSEAGVRVGAHVPPILGKDLRGATSAIRFEEADRPTLLYIFTPACGWCQRNEDNFNSLLTQNTGQFRAIGLSLSREGLDDYLKTRLQGVPVYSNLEASTTDAYRFGGTPETILVANDGTVIKVWKGAYTGETLQDIEKYFRIKLPGVRQSL